MEQAVHVGKTNKREKTEAAQRVVFKPEEQFKFGRIFDIITQASFVHITINCCAKC
jgi:hypothetical protein